MPDLAEIDNYVLNKTNPGSVSGSIVGEDMPKFRHTYILKGILFEIKCPGMRLTGKAPKCSTIIRKEFGFKGRPIKLAQQLFDLLVEKQVLVHKENNDGDTVTRERNNPTPEVS